MNNYEKIKRACQIANPKLMDLSFGCEIRVPWPLGATKDATPMAARVINMFDQWIYTDNWPETPFLDKDLIEILGHEPSFADILLVIGKYWGQDFKVGVNGNKLNMAFIDGSADIVHQVTIISWDLTKPLKEQSEEVISFIAQLL